MYTVIFPHLLSEAVVGTYCFVVYVVRDRLLLLVLILFLSLTLEESICNLAIVDRPVILSPERVLLARWSLRSVTSQLRSPLRIWRHQSVIESRLINFTLNAELTVLDRIQYFGLLRVWTTLLLHVDVLLQKQLRWRFHFVLFRCLGHMRLSHTPNVVLHLFKVRSSIEEPRALDICRVINPHNDLLRRTVL